ncbi:MAG: M15 family metallopeptidase [Rhodocyclaceae bacterium]|nr:M15 family metallopeptidase [Rhodocyclaceae bacterium]
MSSAMDAFSYRTVAIEECGEPLVDIPGELFSFTRPHPYAALGAPYGEASPWLLRRRVLAALLQAQAELAACRPGWRLKLFDAYRPVPVQAFMVWREFRLQAERAGRSLAAYQNPAELQARDADLYRLLAATVFEFWGVPSDDPRTPPPHGTGAAVDLTLEDASGREIDMGSPIDETTARSYPDHFANAAAPFMQAFHDNRQLLDKVMTAAGFRRHRHEWWHFSLGDQMWAWAQGKAAAAVYGRAE